MNIQHGCVWVNFFDVCLQCRRLPLTRENGYHARTNSKNSQSELTSQGCCSICVAMYLLLGETTSRWRTKSWSQAQSLVLRESMVDSTSIVTLALSETSSQNGERKAYLPFWMLDTVALLLLLRHTCNE